MRICGLTQPLPRDENVDGCVFFFPFNIKIQFESAAYVKECGLQRLSFLFFSLNAAQMQRLSRLSNGLWVSRWSLYVLNTVQAWKTVVEGVSLPEARHRVHKQPQWHSVLKSVYSHLSPKWVSGLWEETRGNLCRPGDSKPSPYLRIWHHCALGISPIYIVND